jgi:hypothetical protein
MFNRMFAVAATCGLLMLTVPAFAGHSHIGGESCPFCCGVDTSGGPEFQLTDRWVDTATNPPSGAQGTPITLTWGFVPNGTTTSGGGASDLISFLDTIIGAGPGGADLTQRPWFTFFNQSFNRWGQLNGINYVYEPADDSAAMSSGNNGVLGVRADVRIGGRFIDGPGNVLAFNNFPDFGDMVIDTGDVAFYSSTTNNRRQLRNVIMHEHGHGMGLLHVESSNAGFLMEPFIQTGFDGPQMDDILAAQRHYGDALEKTNNFQGNDSVINATSMGTVAAGTTVSRGASAAIGPTVQPTASDYVSIDGSSDTDFFSFSVSGPSTVSLTLTPRGVTYNQGPQGGAQAPYTALTRNDLALTLFGSDGSTVLDLRNLGGTGILERISDFPIAAAGTYFLRVRGSVNDIQLYQLDVNAQAALAGQAWNVDSDGNWTNPGNWVGGVPNALDALASFGSTISTARQITLDAPQTAGRVRFENANEYTVGGSQLLTLDSVGGSVGMSVLAGSHTVSAPILPLKNVTFSVVPTGSTLTVSALQPMFVPVTKNGAGVLAVNNLRTPSVILTAGTIRTLPNGSSAALAGTSVTNSLSIAPGASVDLTNNAFVIDYAALGTLLNDTRVNIVNNRLVSSLLDSTTAIGYADNATLGRTSFGGVTVDPTSLLIRYTRQGDANLDGTTNIADFAVLGASFNLTGAWQNGDFNYDQLVNIGDFSLLAANFNQSVPAFAGRPGAIPEPASAAGAMLMMGLIARRRR